MTATFEAYEDKKGEWRWTLRHQNGNVIADSAEGYTSRDKAVQGIQSVKDNAPTAPIKDVVRAQ